MGMAFGKGFPAGPAQFLVTEFVRTVEQALDLYEKARQSLEESSRSEALIRFVRASGDLEVAYLVLNKATRIGEALVQSPESTVSKARLPAEADRHRLRLMRNAIEHEVGPIKAGRGGQGDSLSLEVRGASAQIADESGTYITTHQEVADWVRTLHGLAADLIEHPDAWVRASS
jgi:hypothetical protein